MSQKQCRVEGLGKTGVMIIGEAPGESEGIKGLPFRPEAPAGRILEKAITRLGFKREDFWLSNIVDRRPPNNWLEGAPWEREMIDFCLPKLRGEIDRLQPACLLALGGVALRELTGWSGEKKSVTYLRGYALPSVMGVPVVGGFHPAYLARGQQRLLGLLMNDIVTAVAVARGGERVVTNPFREIQCWTTVDDLELLIREIESSPDLAVAYDLETESSTEEDEDAFLESGRDGEDDGEYNDENEDTVSLPHGTSSDLERFSESGSLDTRRASIRTVQFAVNSWGGVSVHYNNESKELIEKALATPNRKIGHNSTHFDLPILKNHGLNVKGRKDDTLHMWRCLQPDLPGHLQAVAGAAGWKWPWKHLAGSDLEFYGVADVCSVLVVDRWLEKELRRLGMWEWYDVFTRKFFEDVVHPMCERGLPVSRDRLDETREWAQGQIRIMDLEIQKLAPDELKVLEPKEGYKNMPLGLKEFVRLRHPEFFEPIPKYDKSGNRMCHKESGEPLYRSNPTKLSEVYRWMLDNKGGPSLEETYAEIKKRWPEYIQQPFGTRTLLVRRLPFNTRSAQQMLAYLKLKGYPVPTRFKDGKETTSDKEMQRLEITTKDPLIALSRRMRATSKLVDSYLGKIPEGSGEPEGGWIPEKDGRLRAIITFKSTGQLAASPNIMTLPKRRPELAERFRKCLEAEPGHVYMAFDYSNFHGLTTALESRDKQMYRLAAIDVHSFVAGHMVRFPGVETCLDLGDSDLKEFLGEIKKKHKPVREFQAKPAVHGTNFGQGYRRLYFEYREHFRSEIEARRLLDLLRSLFPRVFQWQDEVCDLADRQGYLQSRWGARRWFWDVYEWRKGYDGRWVKQNGKDAEKAKAFLPSNDAHGMLRFKLLDMAERGWLERYGLVNIVHDEVLFHCPIRLKDEAIEQVGRFLEEPVARLADETMCPEGFVCGVEASWGHNRGEMKEEKFK